MSKLTKALTAAAGNAGGDNLYVEDVFSTYLYTGTSTSPNTITNGIDLADSGGLVWLKTRTAGFSHTLFDTERGVNKELYSDDAGAEGTGTSLTAFNSDGFTLGTTSILYNSSSYNYASWTFRKAEKFFDVVTYTGSAATQNIAHNLGSTPAMIIIKRTDTGPSDWIVYHQGLNNGTDPEDYYLILNGTASENNAWIFNKTAPTDTTFTVGGGTGNVNTSGGSYVAYLFASDAGGFGDDGSDSIIKCGSYTGNGSTDGPEIDLGFEPQWLLIKVASGTTDNWAIFDTMRGIATGGDDQRLFANLSNAELSGDYIQVNATGFKPTLGADLVNRNTSDYIYIAIRRPMKTPESGTEVFAAVAYTGNGATNTITASFPVDLHYAQRRSPSDYSYLYDRLRGKNATLQAQWTGAEFNNVAVETNFDSMTGVNYTGLNLDVSPNQSSNPYIGWEFRRATGFFDVVAYTGTGVTNRKISHNLTVAPEIVIVKNRNTPQNWYNYHSGDPTGYTQLNTSNASQTDGKYYFGDDVNIIAPTSTVFTVGGANAGVSVNGSAETYIAYLFASLDGVSKVGSYTGTGSNVNVDCGFSAGARFILIKRTDSTGDWYVWDSERGIVAGNDPYLLLNTTAAEVTSTDYIDPLSSGFTVTSSAPAALNASGGTYIFLAIA